MADTFLKEVNGQKVYVTDEGKFVVTIGPQTSTRSKLADLEREIARRTTVRVSALQVLGYHNLPRRIQLVACEGGRFRDDQGNLYRPYERLWRDNAEVYEQMAALVREYQEMQEQYGKQWVSLVEQLRALRFEDWPELVRQCQVASEQGSSDDVSPSGRNDK